MGSWANEKRETSTHCSLLSKLLHHSKFQQRTRSGSFSSICFMCLSYRTNPVPYRYLHQHWQGRHFQTSACQKSWMASYHQSTWWDSAQRDVYSNWNHSDSSCCIVLNRSVSVQLIRPETSDWKLWLKHVQSGCELITTFIRPVSQDGCVYNGLYTIDRWIIAFYCEGSFIMATYQWDKQNLILFVFSTFQTHILLPSMGIHDI